MKKKKLCLLLIVCSLLLSGCWDANEPERLVYANGFGVDYKDGKVIVYVQIINLGSLAKAESGAGGSTSKADVGRAEGHTFEEAIFSLYHTSDRRMYLGHLSFVVFSEQAIKAGMLEHIADFLDRYRETRYRMYFFATKDSIKDIMLVSPIENISLAFSKLSDPHDNYRQSSFIPPIDLRELIINFDEPPHQAQLPLLQISKKWTAQDGPKKELLIEKAAIISDNTLISILPKEIMNGARLTNEEFIRDSLYLSKRRNADVSVLIYDKKLKIKPVVDKAGKVRFDIKLKINANIQMVKEQETVNALKKEISQAMRAEVYRTYHFTRKQKIDIFRLSETLYRDDNKTWKKVQKNGLVPLEEDTIKSLSINVQLKNSGKMELGPIIGQQQDRGDQK
ncbi:Ger(x)C family spore germination protein [Peribacillus sp. Hz7]|uniref:Ger(x)C family spore germination protein n=1 Tax=Peribacillus sp. Hz7 TaxID=3344873 RepID=UPI0035CB2C22